MTENHGFSKLGGLNVRNRPEPFRSKFFPGFPYMCKMPPATLYTHMYTHLGVRTAPMEKNTRNVAKTAEISTTLK